VASQIGVAPLQSLFEVQPTHAPAPVSQRLVVPVHEIAFVAEHAPHAPVGWHAGVAPPQSPSEAQPPQLCVVASQTGLSAGHWASAVQPMQAPELASHSGVAPVQAAALVVEHCPHAPLGWQAGAETPHWASLAQATHAWAVVSQTGFVEPHWGLASHVAQTPSAVSHAEVGPVQAALLVEEQTPHEPFGWHAGVAPPHWLSLVQPVQACVVTSQVGVVPLHWALLVHATQAPVAASHADFAPPQRPAFVVEH
jgi:hypothetical protein